MFKKVVVTKTLYGGNEKRKFKTNKQKRLDYLKSEIKKIENRPFRYKTYGIDFKKNSFKKTNFLNRNRKTNYKVYKI